MLACKNKLFKKLLLFSFIFLIFSLFCNKIIYADMSKEKTQTKIYSNEVKVQQQEIISSLRKIEGCIDTQKENL